MIHSSVLFSFFPVAYLFGYRGPSLDICHANRPLPNVHHDAYRSQISGNSSPLESSHAAPTPASQNHPSSQDSNSDENVAVAFNPPASEGECASDLSFKKKDVQKARTQSFQSVLSTASLKSMKLSAAHPLALGSRNGSVVGSNQNGAPSNVSVVSKDFQSFIQAPVLSSTSTYKPADESDIGRQLPFNEDSKQDVKRRESKSTAIKMDDDSIDQDLIVQQQKLTLNALRKLSLSPMPFVHVDETAQIPKRTPLRRESKPNAPEPYQPAQVDLSSFASLTRQPKFPEHTEPSRNSVPSMTRIHDLPTEEDHLKGLRQAHSEPQTFVSGPTGVQEPLVADQSSTNSFSHAQKQHPSQAEGSNQTRFQNQTSSIPPSYQSNIQPQQPQPHPSNQLPSSTHLPQRTFQIRSSSFHNSAQEQRVPPPAVQQPHDMLRRKGLNLSVPSHAQFQPSAQPQRQQSHNVPHLVSLSQAAKLGTNVRQIKGLRTPMYVPAVLRMTSNQSEPVKDLKESEQEEILPTIPPVSATPNEDVVPRPSALTSTVSEVLVWSQELNRSQNSVESGYPNAIHHQKTTPTRRHWIKDEAAIRCGITGCPVVFNFFERRHHCRKCGGIFCSEHTSHYLYINHMAQFTTGGRGILSRVCNNCISDYNIFINREFGVNVPVEDSNPTSTPLSSEPLLTINAPSKASNSAARNDSVVGSVPANWTWSSF